MEQSNLLPTNLFNKRHIELTFEGKPVMLKEDILEKTNRYYIPIMGFLEELNRILIEKGNNKGHEFEKVSVNEEDMINMEGVLYSKLFNIVQLLKLKCTWDYSGQKINLFVNREESSDEKDNRRFCRKALIRLEDITAGGEYYNAENLEKLRLIGDMLWNQNMNFHISWIPRFVDPQKNIDNDLVNNYCMENCDFIFTLDHMISRGGIIGLHGYTHQFGEEDSTSGREFTKDRITTESEIRDRVEKSINTAQKLNIPYAYFESPHYAETKSQIEIIENYFDYIYEPYYFETDHSKNPYRSPMNNSTIFVPAPLGYLESIKTKDVIRKLINCLLLPGTILYSFYYHPSLEFSLINIYRDEDGYPRFDYNKNSPLKKLIKVSFFKGCKFIKINEIM